MKVKWVHRIQTYHGTQAALRVSVSRPQNVDFVRLIVNQTDRLFEDVQSYM
jgi:hypothetical protein